MSDPFGSGAAGGTTPPALIRQIRGATSLSDLAELLDARSLSEAYFRAKDHWANARDDVLRPGRKLDGFPGDRIVLDDLEVTVHGLTHADTEPERQFVRDHATDYLSSDAAVYCEQGIRDMYLDDVAAVCAMDDYRWAMARSTGTAGETHGDHLVERHGDHLDAYRTSDLELFVADLSERVTEFREATFSLIESGRDLYGDQFATALGDVASSFLTSNEDLATGEDFEAFRKTRRAARDPSRLADLQRYFWHAFLPQPLEREWLRRHDPELELFTHARNERMADHLIHEASSPVHVLVGAAHQPGVIYYLQQYRDGRREPGEFDYVE